MLTFENDGFRPAPPYGAEFHQKLIVAYRVEPDRYVLVPVRVDEEQAPQQHSLRIDCRTGRPVGSDVERGVEQKQRLVDALPLMRG